MWFLFVSEIESIPCWSEIPVPTGTWICHSSVPYYCTQISVPWRLQEVDTSAETLHFWPRGVLRGHEMSTFGLTWNLKSSDRNKQFISNIPRNFCFYVLACLTTRWQVTWTSAISSLFWTSISYGLLLIREWAKQNITKTCLYKVDPLKPHFHIVKLEFTGVYIIFLISAQKHRLWVLVRTASPRRF